ncbi:hypothetical protein AB1Y20_007227 [Prymnesium parvum]|uniref:DUF711 family protein n=1 Tax=Prymnesium parvum TaxID=97485 RepID=A0AB34IX20_PRYPA
MAAPLVKVRTITVGLTLERGAASAWPQQLADAAAFTAAAAAAFTAAGFVVQTTRIATNSFEEYLDCSDRAAALAAFAEIDAHLLRLGVELFNAGPARSAAALSLITEVIRTSPRISASGTLPSPHDRAAARRLAECILTLSRETPRGEGNFQFAAACNVPPGTPFFPAAYHAGPPSFAIGCETAALLADALPRAAGDLAAAQALVQRAFEEALAPLERVARGLAAAHALPYAGIDASVAPLSTAPPLTDAFEAVGLGGFGQSGTLAVAALVTGALKAISGVKLCGYMGLMLPPLEDAGLARRANEGAYRLHDVLLYSAVCGLGLDTVPVPGDVPPEKLEALLLDVAALAFRLDKPLTARLFPVPGRRAGEQTDFQHPILCNAAIFEVP